MGCCCLFRCAIWGVVMVFRCAMWGVVVCLGVPCGVVRASRPSSRIVGGSATGANQFPWVVMLVKNGRFICGGGLIDPLHVVTAAHCVKR